MSSWQEEEERGAAAAEGVDFSRFLWVGVLLIFALLVGAMFVMREPAANFSQVQVRHILIPAQTQDPAERQRSLELAQTVRSRVLEGDSFEDLARQYSGDPGSASRGGYLGWTKRGVYSPPFEEYVWLGEVGAISDLIVTEHGFHIVQIIDRQLSEADKYDIEIDRKAWEQQRQEQSGGTPAPAPTPPPALANPQPAQ